MSTIVEAVRLGLAALLIVSGTAKLRRPALFRAAVADYAVLPIRAVGPVASALPIAELVIGLALLLDFTAVAAAAAAAALFAVFIAGMVVNLVRGRSIACGCLGVSRDTNVSWALVGRNLLLTVAALAVVEIGLDASAELAPALVAAAAMFALLMLLSAAVRARAALGRLVGEAIQG